MYADSCPIQIVLGEEGCKLTGSAIHQGEEHLRRAEEPLHQMVGRHVNVWR